MDTKIFSEVEPTNVDTGKIWIKPSTATAYMRFGSTWISLGSMGDPISFTKQITVLLDGIDITSLIGKDSLVIEDILTREVDTCAFIIQDSTGTNRPTVGQEVVIFYKDTPSSTPVIRFAGLIDERPQEQMGIGTYLYEIVCTDYTQELNKKQVVEVYEAQLVGDIVKDIIETYALGLGSAFVQDGTTVDYIAFNYKYPMECLEELADLVGFDWYVDYERHVHFFASTTNAAPYDLDETVNTGEFKDLVVSVNKTELRNTITIRGGYEFTALYTQEIVADGIQESFPLRYEAFTPISAFVDSGGGYVAKTLGIENIDTTGRDFVYSSAEKVIKNLDLALLTAGHKLKVTYKYKKRIITEVEDANSIELMKQFEGGDGIHYAPLLVDELIETKAQARARGLAELSLYSNPLVEGTFTTTQYGYRSGQLLTLNLPTRGIVDKQYLIQTVTATSLGLGKFEYSVTFATLLKGLTEYLIQLSKDSSKSFARTDEILDRWKDIADESVTIGDSNLTEFRRNTTTDPYKWSNDGGTTPGKGQYNKSSWG